MPLALLVTASTDPRLTPGTFVPGPFNGPLLLPDVAAVVEFLDNHFVTADLVAVPVGRLPKVAS